MSSDEAIRLADESLRSFIEAMAAAGNPGSGRHELGLHHVRGWILEWDGTLGGSEIQAVVGIDGCIHAPREPRALRTHTLSAADWVQRDEGRADPAVRAQEFADHLTRILAFNGVGDDARGAEQPEWGPPLAN